MKIKIRIVSALDDAQLAAALDLIALALVRSQAHPVVDCGGPQSVYPVVHSTAEARL